MDNLLAPRIVGVILRTAHVLAKSEIDTERFCCLVSDQEWQEIIDYVGRFQYREQPDIGIETMRFAGLEIIKRSTVSADLVRGESDGQ